MGMVPGADSFKKGETEVPPFFLYFFCIFCLIWFCKDDVKWVGSGRGRLRPVQNDRTGCLGVLEWVLIYHTIFTPPYFVVDCLASYFVVRLL